MWNSNDFLTQILYKFRITFWMILYNFTLLIYFLYNFWNLISFLYKLNFSTISENCFHFLYNFWNWLSSLYNFWNLFSSLYNFYFSTILMRPSSTIYQKYLKYPNTTQPYLTGIFLKKPNWESVVRDYYYQTGHVILKSHGKCVKWSESRRNFPS